MINWKPRALRHRLNVGESGQHAAGAERLAGANTVETPPIFQPSRLLIGPRFFQYLLELFGDPLPNQPPVRRPLVCRQLSQQIENVGPEQILCAVLSA